MILRLETDISYSYFTISRDRIFGDWHGKGFGLEINIR